jgi:homoserine O-succinyltransferase
MPIKVQSDLPAKEQLENENIFVMDESRAMHQDIRPLKVVVLNLMPIKQDTELQLLRAFSNTPLQIDVTFLMVKSHISQNTSVNHLNRFYEAFESVRNHRYDGMIITGAPVEQMPFEEVDYWDELVDIMEWSKTHVTSTLHICWGAQAALYYYFGLQKTQLPEKLFGIYEHEVKHRRTPLVRGFDDFFFAPHSRHTTVDRDAMYATEGLTILAESPAAGVLLSIANEGKQIFLMGHPEYDRYTLDAEYKRDLAKNLPIHIPVNYYPQDDPTQKPRLQWRGHCNMLYSNWLNYYVYQVTPYDLES